MLWYVIGSGSDGGIFLLLVVLLYVIGSVCDGDMFVLLYVIGSGPNVVAVCAIVCYW